MKEIDNDVQRCLEIVDISRVFDVEGLWEVLGEVGRDSETGDKDDEEKGYEEGVEMIVIDNMTHLVNELFARKERSEGASACVTSFYTSSFSQPKMHQHTPS